MKVGECFSFTCVAGHLGTVLSAQCSLNSIPPLNTVTHFVSTSMSVYTFGVSASVTSIQSNASLCWMSGRSSTVERAGTERPERRLGMTRISWIWPMIGNTSVPIEFEPFEWLSKDTRKTCETWKFELLLPGLSEGHDLKIFAAITDWNSNKKKRTRKTNEME